MTMVKSRARERVATDAGYRGSATCVVVELPPP
jgi:hypothetical protein